MTCKTCGGQGRGGGGGEKHDLKGCFWIMDTLAPTLIFSARGFKKKERSFSQ
jgi:hypothetical protein